jgi:hypothetical protein
LLDQEASLGNVTARCRGNRGRGGPDRAAHGKVVGAQMETRGGAALVVTDGDESGTVEVGSMLPNLGKTQNWAGSEARWGLGVTGNLHGGCAQLLWALVEVGARCSGGCHGV